MKRSALAIRSSVILLAACALLGAVFAQAADIPSDKQLRFRRVYAPAERIRDWPKGDGIYKPMDAAEFERLVGPSGETAADGVANAWIHRATYTAQLQGDELLVGEVVYDVQHASDGTIMMPMGPCGIAITSTNWQENGVNRPAQVGLDGDGRLVLLVRKPGRLHCQWSLRGRRDAAGQVQFQMQLPPSVAKRMELTLPKSLTPTISEGLMAALGDTDGGPTSWRIDLGGRSRVQLKIAKPGVIGSEPRLNLLRQAVTYDFTPRGLQVDGEYTVSVYRDPLKQLTILLDPELKLIDARLGDSPIAWITRSPPKRGEQAAFVLTLPQPITGADRIIRLRALAPLKMNSRWTLPRIDLQGLFWQEGTATLLIADPLRLAQLQLQRCRQSLIGPLPGTGAGEAIGLQFHSLDAAVEVLLTAESSATVVDCATTFTLDDRAIAGRMVCDVAVSGPERFLIQATVAEPWRVDSVVSDPPDVIEAWHLKKNGPRRTLDVHLKRGVSAAAPLRLVISGHNRRSPLGRRIDARELRLCQFDEDYRQRRLLHVVSREPYRTIVSGPGALRQLGPLDLTVEDRARLGVEPSGMLWRDATETNVFSVTLEKPSPRFVTETSIAATVTRDTLHQVCRIACTPQASVVDRLIVRFAGPQADVLTWSVVDVHGDPLEGVSASPSPLAVQDDAATGETWTVAWNRPLGEPFLVIVDRRSALAGPTPVNLVSVPFAADESGTVTLRGDAGIDVAVENNGLKPLPAPQVPGDRYNTVRAVYRYDPGRDTADSVGSPLTVGIAKSSSRSAGGVIWHAASESWYERDGGARHQVVLRMENEGRRHLVATLRPGMELLSASVDGMPIRVAYSDVIGQASVPLPEGRRFPIVRLQLRNAAGPRWFGWLRRVRVPDPGFDLPVLVWHRLLHSPPGYVAANGLNCQRIDPEGTNWRRRLFGSAGRGQRTAVFDPFDRDSWMGTSGRRPVDIRQQRRFADRFLADFGTLLKTAGEPITWERIGEVLRKDGGVAAPSAVQADAVWIDSHALADAGISARSAIAISRKQDATWLAVDVLKQANLVVVSTGRSVLLTAPQRIAAGSSNYPWLIEGAVCGVAHGDNTGPAVDFSAEPHQRPWAVPARVWVLESGGLDAPWTAASRDASQQAEIRGWTTVILPADGDDIASVYLVDRAFLTAMTWSAFLLVFAAATLWMPSRMQTRALLTILAAVLALVLPLSLAPIASAVLLGLIAALFWRLVPWPRLPRPEERRTVLRQDRQTERLGDITVGSTQTQHFSRPDAFLLLFAIGLLVVLVEKVGADESASEAMAGAKLMAPAHVVFVPVDAANKPVGDTVYVPERLFDALHRRASSQRDELSGWLLTGAVYRGQLAWGPDRNRLAMAAMTASFAVEVFGRNAQVRIPLGDAALEDRIITVDGNPVQSRHTERDSDVVISIAEPGLYHVDVVLRPATEIVGDRRRLELGIPSLVTSRLELDVPFDAPQIEVVTATGGVIREAVRGHVSAQLGAADRLVLSWRDGGVGGAATVDDVDQLLWLKIQPGAVVVDARFRLNVTDRRLRRLRLATDPQLRLLPPARAVVDGKSIELSHVRTIPGDPQTIELEYERSVSGVQDVRLAFLLADITGVGNVRLPYLELIGARTSRHWVAVSLDASLRIDRNSVPQIDALTPIRKSNGSDTWPLGAEQPTLYYRQSRLGIDWSFPAYPQESETVAQQRLSLSFAQDHADAQIEADLETTAGYHFQHRIRVPKGFNAEVVSLLVDGVDRVARWILTEDRVLTLFLDGPVTGRQQLKVRGTYPAAIGTVEVPPFKLEDAALRSNYVALYRQVTVQIDPKEIKGLEPVGEEPISLMPATFGRYVGAFTKKKVRQPARVKLRPNQLQVKAIQVTSATRNDGQWGAEIDLRLSVQAGVLDELRLRVPPEFKEPFAIEPDLPSHLDDLAGGDDRVLVIRPPRAIQGDFRLSIRGPLAISSGDLIGPPNVLPGEIEDVERYIALPRQVDLQKVEWKTAGLVRRPLPEDPEQATLAEESMETFFVAAPSYQVVLNSVGRKVSAAKVGLADIRVYCRNLQRFVGHATFDLEPAGLSKVRIRWPQSDVRLLSARVAGLKAILSRNRESWEVALGSVQLPQRIELIYEADFRVDHGPQRIAIAPQLFDGSREIGVAETLWSVAAPAELPSAVVSDQGDAAGAVDVMMQQQYQRIAHMLDLVSNVTSAEPADVLAPWYRRWIDRLRNANQQLSVAIAAAGGRNTEKTELWRERLNELDQRLDGLRTQLIAQGILTSRDPVQDSPARSGNPWEWSSATTVNVRRGVFAGARPQFNVGNFATKEYDLFVRLFLAAALSAVAFLIAVKEWEPWRTITAHASPSVLAFVAALCCWLFLVPSVLGFAAALVIACAALGLGWRMPKGKA